ncbi:MAG: crotonase/enoyl-CoA hydratase family protein, partial [Alphaproteobacteria bacterium]|nr:crotonase/enoyl-CoA hydratase family protein [Alphaproteobacteria bacterium]
MTDRIKVTMDGGVADVRLVRTDKMNALDNAMFQALVETGEGLKKDKDVRAVVLSGEGRAFCAGLDMGNFAQMASGERKPGVTGDRLGQREYGIANAAQQACLVWQQIPVPVIAAVHGVAFGGGFQLALGADMRYVAPDVRMAVLEIKWGLVPDMAGVLLMPSLARNDVIRELTYTGRIFNGHEALQYGFATRVCDKPLEEALKTAHEIAGKNPHAIRAGKRLLNLALEGDAGTVLLAETTEQVALIGSPNLVEAVTANMPKRDPKFASVA